MYNIDFEINCFRQSIRASGYTSDPFKDKSRTSFRGKPLDSALKDFHVNSLQHREEFMNFLVDHSLSDRKNVLQCLSSQMKGQKMNQMLIKQKEKPKIIKTIV